MTLFPDIFERVLERFTGPMHIRFVVQPAMAIVLGILDGVRDAKAGRLPFVWSLCVRPEARKNQLKTALQRLTIPLIIAILIDAVVQYLLFDRVRVWGAVLTGTIIMGLPYSVARGIANRIALMRGRKPIEIRRRG